MSSGLWYSVMAPCILVGCLSAGSGSFRIQMEIFLYSSLQIMPGFILITDWVTLIDLEVDEMILFKQMFSTTGHTEWGAYPPTPVWIGFSPSLPSTLAISLPGICAIRGRAVKTRSLPFSVGGMNPLPWNIGSCGELILLSREELVFGGGSSKRG